MGGLLSEEFQALSPIGEDILVIDDENKYATNIEVTPCVLEGTASAEEKDLIAKYYTGRQNNRTSYRSIRFAGHNVRQDHDL